jgi:hypothetical protein
MQFSEEQIKQLAPDDASASAGRQLANPAKWVVKCRHETALWGDCQGSGKVPYSTIVDLTNLAFKCTCPSRKFPCKHGLGLLFLFARSPEAFQPATDLAPHVEEWMGKRTARQAAKSEQEAKPVDEKARQKRADQRTQKVNDGVAELTEWLKDLARTGIMPVAQNAYGFTQKIMARMHDAQAPGLAARLKNMGEIKFYQEGWQRELLQQLAYTYMLTSAYRKLPDLPPLWQEEVKTQIGYTLTKEEVAQQGTPVEDDWFVAAVQHEQQDKLKVEKTWLWGKNTGQFALSLQYSAPGQPLPFSFLPGVTTRAELVYYPSAAPLRVLVKSSQTLETGIWPDGLPTLEAALDTISTNLANQPFQRQIPVILRQMRVVWHEQRWWIRDHLGQSLPLQQPNAACVRIMAASLGAPFDAMVLWDNGQWSVVSYWQNQHFFTA